MRLTGFKSKKSIIEGKRDLVKSGLIRFISGTGHLSSKYYFSFEYKNSKITPQRCAEIHPGGGHASLHGEESGTSPGGHSGNPNNINITITNNQKVPILKKENEKKNFHVNDLIQEYGSEIFSISVEKAKKKNLENNYPYMKAICLDTQNQLLKKNHSSFSSSPPVNPSWEGFLDWARNYLPNSTVNFFKNLDIKIEGRTIFISEEVPVFQKQIIYKFFTEEIVPPILVVFSDSFEKKENRLEYFR